MSSTKYHFICSKSSLLSYQWWKGTNTSTILSTSNNLYLPNFNPTTDAGMYHVRIYYANSANTCIDVQVDYLIDLGDFSVNAGQNTTKYYCETQEI